MRNLKKVLSLTLALVMMLGMMTFAGAAETKKITAADFKDMDKVENKEAVSLLVDLGVLNGIKAADGTYTFNPAGNIERGAYAKMVYAVMMASNNADVYKGVNTGLTDVKGHWAEGFIGYCVSTKIAVGNPNKTFAPNANITVVAASKMLLTALGYDAKASGYENDALWSINIMRDAQGAGLMDGIAQSAGDIMTRDTAAQLIYNALFAKTVTPKFAYDMGVKYLDEYREGDALGLNSFKLAKITAVATANEASKGATLKGKTDLIGHLGTATKTTLEDLGKNVTYYTFNSTGVSTFAFPTSKNHVYTIDAAMDADDATKWLSSNGLTVSNGGAKDATLTNYAWAGTETNAATALQSINNAVVATAIDNNGDGIIDVISKVTKSLSKVTGEVKTKTATDNTVTVYVPGITGTYETVVGAKDLAKNDWATWIKIGDVYNITECATVEGKVTGYKGSGATGTVYIDGAPYKISSIANGAWDTVGEYTGSALGYKDAAKFWLDDNKNLVFAKKTDSTVTYNTAIVLGYDTAGTATTAENVGTAKLLFADGTVQVVKVNSFKKSAADGVSTGTSDAFGANAGFDHGKVAFETNYKFAAFTVATDGKYDLVEIDADADVVETVKYTRVAMADNGINPGYANFLITKDAATPVATMVGNANTVFVVATYDSPATKVTGFKVYTGIANAPKYATVSAEGATGTILTADGIAKLVFITGGSSVSVGKDSKHVFIAAGAVPAYDGAKETYTYETGAFVDGVEVKNLVSEVTLTANKLQEVELNADGVVVVKVGAAKDFGNAGVKYNNGVIAVNTATTAAYSAYTEDVMVAVIDKDGKSVTTIDPTNIDTDINDTVFFTKDANTGKITNLYIQKVAVVAADATSALKYDVADSTSFTNALADNLDVKATLNNNVKFKVKATPVAGYTVTVTIIGNAGTATITSDGTVAPVIAEYTANATDETNKFITVKVLCSDGTSEITTSYKVLMAD